MAEIFFSPGLGGERAIELQRKHIERLNRFFRKQIYFFDPRWETDESEEAKLERLFQAYDEAGQPNKIFGVSAGATNTIILGARNPNAQLTTLAGKHKGSASIGPDYQERAPAFLPFVRRSETILKEDPSIPPRLITYSPWLFDGTVPMEDIHVGGADNRTIYVPRHTPMIVAGLVIVLPFV